MKSITPEEAQEIIKKGEAVVIDVRTPAEFERGHIPDAQNIDISDSEFEEKINALDHNKNYIINCQSGGRSSRATIFMQSIGFSNVKNLEGGIMAWMRGGGTVEMN